jgi:hydroxyacylglutathione hydrolase
MSMAQKHDYKLTKVLTTHHHWDHSGGNKTLKDLLPELMIYGGDNRVEALTCKVSDRYTFNLGTLVVECLHTPCHTTGHFSYFVKKDDCDLAVFTGTCLLNNFF